MVLYSSLASVTGSPGQRTMPQSMQHSMHGSTLAIEGFPPLGLLGSLGWRRYGQTYPATPPTGWLCAHPCVLRLRIPRVGDRVLQATSPSRGQLEPCMRASRACPAPSLRAALFGKPQAPPAQDVNVEEIVARILGRKRRSPWTPASRHLVWTAYKPQRWHEHLGSHSIEASHQRSHGTTPHHAPFSPTCVRTAPYPPRARKPRVNAI